MSYNTHLQMSKATFGLSLVFLYWLNLLTPLMALVTEKNFKSIPFLLLAILFIYRGNVIGGESCDYDHPISKPAKRNAFTRFQCFLITKVLMQGHRSRLTHSLDGILIMTAIRYFIYTIGITAIANALGSSQYLLKYIDTLAVVQVYLILLFKLHVVGFLFGALGHWFADTLNKDGAYLLSWIPWKVYFVPANFGIALRIPFTKKYMINWKPFEGYFVTGKAWEKKAQKGIKKFSYVTAVIGIVCIFIGTTWIPILGDGSRLFPFTYLIKILS